MIPLLSQDTDLAEVLLACTEGRLNQVNISITPGFACNVAVAVEGYPESYRQGDVVEWCAQFHVDTTFFAFKSSGAMIFYVKGRSHRPCDNTTNATD